MTPLERVKRAEEELVKAIKQLEEPRYSEYMKKIINTVGQYYEYEVIEDNDGYPCYGILLKTTAYSSGILDSFKKLYKEGLFVGNFGWRENGIVLYFFTKHSP